MSAIDLRVHICIPSAGSPKPRFALALASMVAHYITHWLPFANTQTVSFNLAENALISHARDSLVLRALQRGATHILFVDDDIEMPPAALCQLLQHRKAIVAANYRMRRPGGDFVAGNLAGDDRARVTFDAPALEEVAYCGMGLCLINCAVFDSLPLPRFPVAWNEERNEYVGEDIVFCTHAREAGYPIFVDNRLSRHVYHLGGYRYGWQGTPDLTPEPDA